MLNVAAVFVGGFDFGTSADDLKAHMGAAGTVVKVEMKKGNAVVTYASPEEAKDAVSSLNKSTIPGNERFIDVKIDKKSLPPIEGKTGKKRPASGGGGGGSCKVLVRGFDIGTTDEQLESHMSSVGTIEAVYWVSQKMANVEYSSAEEATAAVAELNETTIPGNERYIDVIIGGDRAADRAADRGKRFKGGGKGEWMMVPVPMPWDRGYASKGSFGKGGGGKGKKGGKGKRGDHSDEDPAGSGRVFVRGFDFGTSDEELESHMKKAGPIHTVHWVNKGNAVVVYKKAASAEKACNTLDNTTIKGNSRYINVSPRN